MLVVPQPIAPPDDDVCVDDKNLGRLENKPLMNLHETLIYQLVGKKLGKRNHSCLSGFSTAQEATSSNSRQKYGFKKNYASARHQIGNLLI